MPRFPIGLKLLAMAALLVAAVTTTFGVLVSSLLRDVYAERASRLESALVLEHEHASRAAAELLRSVMAEAIAGSEAGRIARHLKELASHETDLVRAAVADERGRVIARSDLGLFETLDRNDRIAVADTMQSRDGKSDSGERVRVVTAPIRDGSGRLVGGLELTWSLAALDRSLSELHVEEARDTAASRRILFEVGGIALAVGVLAGVLMGITLGRPIRTLGRAARAISSGDLSVRVPVRRRDELGDLGRAMNEMAERLEVLIEDAKVSVAIERDLVLAREIQQSMLPGRGNHQRPGIELAGRVESAAQCGGDFWATCELTRQRTLILVADVTGHGIGSAMLTATARSCLDTVWELTQGNFRPAYLLRILDQLLRHGVGAGFHMTCFVSILDPVERTISYANAGHNHPLLVRTLEDGTRRIGRLAARGNRLGDADGFTFTEKTVACAPGDILCWYTDGLVEALGVSGDGQTLEEFGTRRLGAALLGSDGDADAVLDGVLDRFHRHRGVGPLDDDVTCVIGRLLG